MITYETMSMSDILHPEFKIIHLEWHNFQVKVHPPKVQ